MNQKMMNRNVSYQPQQMSHYNDYVQQAVQLDNVLLEEEQTEQKNGEWERNNSNPNSRRNNRSDKVSKNIYQAKKWKK